MTDPASVLKDIEADLVDLDNLHTATDETYEELADAEFNYETAVDDWISEWVEQHEGARTPAKDTMRSLAHKDERIKLLWAKFFGLKRKREKIDRLSKIKGDVLSGRQTQLKTLSAEAAAPQPQWSGRRAA